MQPGRRYAPEQDNSFQECLEITWEHKRSYTVDDIVARASRAIEEGILNGTTVFRVFADVDSIGGIRPLEGILALRDKWKDLVCIQAVDFPQEGIVRDPGTFERMEEGMRLGADVVGGLPWHEWSDEDARRHIDLCFELAKKYDKDILCWWMIRTIPTAARWNISESKTLREDFQGGSPRAIAGALAAYDEAHANKVMALVKEAGISISTNPHQSGRSGPLRPGADPPWRHPRQATVAHGRHLFQAKMTSTTPTILLAATTNRRSRRTSVTPAI